MEIKYLLLIILCLETGEGFNLPEELVFGQSKYNKHYFLLFIYVYFRNLHCQVFCRVLFMQKIL